MRGFVNGVQHIVWTSLSGLDIMICNNIRTPDPTESPFVPKSPLTIWATTEVRHHTKYQFILRAPSQTHAEVSNYNEIWYEHRCHVSRRRRRRATLHHWQRQIHVMSSSLGRRVAALSTSDMSSSGRRPPTHVAPAGHQLESPLHQLQWNLIRA
jgi:hypothetical protein